MTYISQNPFTGKINKTYNDITNKELSGKIELADKAQKSWKHECFHLRGKLLLKVADLLIEDAEYYANLITIEMGKPAQQAIGEVKKCAWLCKYYSEYGPGFLLHKKMESSAELSQIIYDPLGVIFGVMPWNFPFWQIFRFITPTLMAGNSVLLKHASNVPQCAEAIEELFLKAGFKKGIFQNLFIDYKQVEKVIKASPIQGISFTGSNKAGSKIATLAGKHIKKTVMELGGSDPFIVFEDADLNHALELAVLSRFLNAGQSCIAAKRFILHKDIADDFVKNFKALIENFIIGDPLNKNTFLSSMVNSKSVDLIEKQVLDSIKMGAECIIGGQKNTELRNVYQPTLVTNVPRNSPLWKEEVFGPVAVICEFNTPEEAIELANDTSFGLGASLWTEDEDLAHHIAEKLDVGTVAINNMVKSEPGLPFGGVKSSGYGRELAEYGLYEFMNIKTVSFS